jgi:threonine-phosphate decarboxylase
MRFISETRAIHGGRGEYLGDSYEKILDFSASLNPYPPKLDLSISFDSATRYPDDNYYCIKEIISRYHHCTPECITVGNGSVEVLRTLCHTVLRPESSVNIPLHTFSEYELSARLAGGKLIERRDQADLVFLCNPNNPSGQLLTKDTVLKELEKIKDAGLLCVDEAFIDLSDPDQSVSDIINPNLFILRSLTKSYAIAGIRFGYGIGDPDLIAAMEVMRPPWTVNALAESLVMQAFSHYNELSESRELIKKERRRVYNAVINHGWNCLEGSANYLLIDTGEDAQIITRKFLEKHILVRDCTSFHLPNHIRVAIRTGEENDTFIAILENFY